MDLLNNAKTELHGSNVSLVVEKDGSFFKSEERGIKPLVDILRTNPGLLCGAAVADKVIGKAAAMLMVCGGVACAYADVISEPALAFFEAQGVAVEYSSLVQNIINRTGDGICPMEEKALPLSTPEEALSTFLG